MSIDPQSVSSGSEIAVRYDGRLAKNRGGYFYLVNSAGERIAGLWTDKDERGEAGYTTELEEFEILDFSVSGTGPDILLIPTELAPGRYRLCTANSAPDVCATVNVT